MKNLSRAAGLAAALVLLLTLLFSLKCAAFNWWAAGFKDSAGQQAFEWRGNLCFLGSVLSLVALVYLLVKIRGTGSR